MSRTYHTSRGMRSQSEQNQNWKYIPKADAVPEVSRLSVQTIENRTSGCLKPAYAGAQAVFGFMYHTGSQSLSVSDSGNVAPVKFGRHSVLSGIWHEEQSPNIFIETAGVYEISYSVIISASTAAKATFALQADGKNLPGSIIRHSVSHKERMYTAAVLAELKQSSALRLIMMSHSTVNAELPRKGVTASLLIKKLS